MRKQLLVESIRIDGNTQSRERISEETVAEYAEEMKGSTHSAGSGQAGAPWPALTVYFDGTEYWLADGFHRLLATQRIGRKNVMAEVKQGSREDAAWASCAANQTHGLRRTNADKRNAVVIAIKLHEEMSDLAIGRHVGVSREYVLRVRHKGKDQGVIKSHPERRTGADGKSYPVPKSKSKTTAGQGFGPPPGPEERSGAQAKPPTRPPDQAEGAEPPSRKPDSPARSASSGQVDDVGRRIPDHLLELWDRRQEVQDMLTALSRVRVALAEAQKNRDPLFSEIPFSSARAHLDQVYDAVQVAKPYAVCAFCQGHGCKACSERGLLGKFRWDTSVPAEHKKAVARIIEKERGS